MAGKTKAVKPWLVLKLHGDGLYSIAYRGPDRKTAREKAEKALQADNKASLLVVHCSTLEVLDSGDLKASLPRDAF